MEPTWIAIAASLLMGGGALLVFIWAVRGQQFRNFEDVKYQVFWSDQQDLPDSVDMKEQQNGHSTEEA
jgi:cbb3-type cytochrome oxidase maturation protein